MIKGRDTTSIHLTTRQASLGVPADRRGAERAPAAGVRDRRAPGDRARLARDRLDRRGRARDHGRALRRAARAGEVRDLRRAGAGARGAGARGRDPAPPRARRRARSASSPATASASASARSSTSRRSPTAATRSSRTSRWRTSTTCCCRRSRWRRISTAPYARWCRRSRRCACPRPFTCYVSIEQRIPGQAKNAILAALGADLYMKRIVVVDEDVDVFDDRQVNWAIATRCQPDRDITIVTNARGSDLDPSARDDGQTAKWGVDATAKPSLAAYTPRHRVPPDVWQRIDLKDFVRPEPRRGGELRPAPRSQLAAHSAKSSPLVWDGSALTFGELDQRASAFAETLAARGVKAGDRIALSIGNRGASRSRSSRAGGSAPPWLVALTLPNGWAFAADDPAASRSRRDRRAAEAAAVAGRARARPRGPPAQLRRSTRGSHAADRAVLGARRPSPTPPALILYTSGSTGRPKGAVLSHRALVAANESWAGPVMALTPEDVVLARPAARALVRPQRRAARAAARRRHGRAGRALRAGRRGRGDRAPSA